MNTDKITTILGALAGLATVAQQFVPSKYQAVAGTAGGMFLYLTGYFTNKR